MAARYGSPLSRGNDRRGAQPGDLDCGADPGDEASPARPGGHPLPGRRAGGDRRQDLLGTRWLGQLPQGRMSDTGISPITTPSMTTDSTWPGARTSCDR